MESGVHRASRFPFAASIELTDVRSERRLTAFTTTLSLFGCYVLTANPFAEETKVSLRIMRGGSTFTAVGKVVSSKPQYGMGIAFVDMEPACLAILEKWIASLRTK